MTKKVRAITGKIEIEVEIAIRKTMIKKAVSREEIDVVAIVVLSSRIK